MKCKQCGRAYHYCSSCDHDEYYSSGYCERLCYEESDEWKLFSEKVKSFYDSLNKEQKLDLWALWDNGIFIDNKWEKHLDSIILDPRDLDE